MNLYEPGKSIPYKTARAHSEDLDQPARKAQTDLSTLSAWR